MHMPKIAGGKSATEQSVRGRRNVICIMHLPLRDGFAHHRILTFLIEQWKQPGNFFVMIKSCRDKNIFGGIVTDNGLPERSPELWMLVNYFFYHILPVCILSGIVAALHDHKICIVNHGKTAMFFTG